MTSQPPQEPFKQAPISTEQLLTSSSFASPSARRRVFATWGRVARGIAEIAAMRARAPGREPTAQNTVGVSESIS